MVLPPYPAPGAARRTSRPRLRGRATREPGARDARAPGAAAASTGRPPPGRRHRSRPPRPARPPRARTPAAAPGGCPARRRPGGVNRRATVGAAPSVAAAVRVRRRESRGPGTPRPRAPGPRRRAAALRRRRQPQIRVRVRRSAAGTAGRRRTVPERPAPRAAGPGRSRRCRPPPPPPRPPCRGDARSRAASRASRARRPAPRRRPAAAPCPAARAARCPRRTRRSRAPTARRPPRHSVSHTSSGSATAVDQRPAAARTAPQARTARPPLARTGVRTAVSTPAYSIISRRRDRQQPDPAVQFGQPPTVTGSLGDAAQQLVQRIRQQLAPARPSPGRPTARTARAARRATPRWAPRAAPRPRSRFGVVVTDRRVRRRREPGEHRHQQHRHQGGRGRPYDPVRRRRQAPRGSGVRREASRAIDQHPEHPDQRARRASRRGVRRVKPTAAFASDQVPEPVRQQPADVPDVPSPGISTPSRPPPPGRSSSPSCAPSIVMTSCPAQARPPTVATNSATTAPARASEFAPRDDHNSRPPQRP